MDSNRITVYYSNGRNKVDFESFTFSSITERDSVLEMLDLNFLT